MASANPDPIRIVLVEDLPDDVFFIRRALAHAGIDADFVVVTDEGPFRSALREARTSIVLTDHRMPRFNALRAIDVALSVAPWVPVVVVTAAMLEDEATEARRRGARDIVRKEELARLPSVVRRLVGGLPS